MKFASTRGQAAPLSFSEAARQGLAPDGGLYVPESFPAIRVEDFTNLVDDLPAFASRMLAPFFAGDALEKSLPAICAAALDFPIPLRLLPGHAAVLEVFHGPTCAFKDVGARFLAECASRARAREGDHGQKQGQGQGSGQGPAQARATVIVATSGDTGGAVAGAFSGKPGIDVLILFPKGKISARQEKQLTCWGGNVRAFSVRGTFDDCQRVVKEALRDTEWARQMGFMSANSISVGRLLPQAVFHARASVAYRAARGRAPGVIVPTGNLGDAVAALWAKRMGFPIERAILATNANATIRDFLATGDYRPRPALATLANAMDVGDPSNMERLLALYPSLQDLRRDVACELATDAEIAQAIREGPARWGQVWCPHAAAGMVALERQAPGGEWIVVATAHPAKFETIVEPLIGRKVEVPTALQALLGLRSTSVEIAPTLDALRAAVER
jgi:threonine synthase